MTELREKLEEAFDNDGPGDIGTEIDSVTEAAGEPEVNAGDDTETPAEVEPSTDETVHEPGDATEKEPIAASDESPGVEKEEPEKEEQVAEGLAAPYGWKPAMREKYWKELPEEVKAEVIRREVDIAKGMELSANARKLEADFNAKTAPFMAEFASRGVQPMDAFDNYLKTAYNLRHAQPQEKAALIAGIIQQYGVDVGELDTVLTRQIEAAPGSRADPNVLQAINQAMAPVNQFMQNYQQTQVSNAETEHQTIQDEIAAFKKEPANEFYMDVKDDMANLLEAAAMRSQNMTLQEAYDRAILLHSDIAEIVSQRKLQSNANTRDAAAKAAKAKSVGVESTSPDTTTGRTNSQTASLRGALEAAFNADAME